MTETPDYTPTPTLVPPEVEQSVEARNKWLNSRVNPDGTLPPLTIEHPWFIDRYVENEYQVSSPAYSPHGDEPFGFISLRPPESGSAHATVASLQLHIGSIGQQLGVALYLEVMKRLPLGQGLQSGDTLTEGSYKLWRFLEGCGVAVCDTLPEAARLGADDRYHDITFRTLFGKLPEETTGAQTPLSATQKPHRLAGLLSRLRLG